MAEAKRNCAGGAGPQARRAKPTPEQRAEWKGTPNRDAVALDFAPDPPPSRAYTDGREGHPTDYIAAHPGDDEDGLVWTHFEEDGCALGLTPGEARDHADRLRAAADYAEFGPDAQAD